MTDDAPEESRHVTSCIGSAKYRTWPTEGPIIYHRNPPAGPRSGARPITGVHVDTVTDSISCLSWLLCDRAEAVAAHADGSDA